MHHLSRPQDKLRRIMSAPFIFGVLPVLVVFDLFVEIYKQACFRLYRLPMPARKEYIKIDRHRLKYLSFIEKIGCVYCGYANGLMQYASIIAAQTEWYWCSIRHKKTKDFKQPKHHKNFLKYGDSGGVKKIKKTK